MSLANTEYAIAVSKEDESEAVSYTLELWSNDLCLTAFGPLSPSGQTLYGSLERASIDYEAPVCSDDDLPLQPGVWYEVTGAGGLIQASTCDGTFINTQISVYEGNCGSLECVAFNNNACGLQSSVSWDSQAGVAYYVLVHGGRGTSGGTFSLSLDGSASGPLAQNEACLTATALNSLADGEEVTTSVPLANAQVDPAFSGGEMWCVASVSDGKDRRGLWYTIDGTGSTYNIATSGSPSASLTVFGGDCENLNCFAGGLDVINTQEGFWQSVAGVTYTIFVFHVGYDTADGDVALAITAG